MKTPVIAVTLVLASASSARAASPGDVFGRLKSLVGEWQGTTDSGRVLGVSYRLTANGTVLVETWALGAGHESMTLYHVDDGGLLATHYCPLGNQPRLRLVTPIASDTWVFAFVSATNLQDPDAAHQHSFDIRMLDTDTLVRSETYVENGEGEPASVTYARLK